ncbi:Bacterial membrane protein [Leptothrix ochracea L12]|uniref:Bacterial membrane protein n=1 Tax=Leptothrix ochracea L12 TaxID=735332 RepID=I4Z5P6_9BURK|nr:Bacterial membrane protein [Leptothrix ochracea L12]
MKTDMSTDSSPRKLPALSLVWQRIKSGLILNQGRPDGPPDLDDLWRDFNQKLGGLFGAKRDNTPPPKAVVAHHRPWV